MNLRGVLRTELRLAVSQLGSRSGAAGLLIGAMLAAFLVWTFLQSFATLADASVPEAIAVRVFAWVLQLALLGMLVLDLQLAVTRLVAAPELDLLRRAPLAPHQLLGIELVRTLPQSSGMLLTFALPAWIGLTAAYPGMLARSALLPPVLALLWVIALGSGIAIALALLRIVPAARLREALGLLATLVVTLSWLAGSFLLPRVDRERGLDAVFAGALPTLPTPPLWSPAQWAAEALTGTGRAWVWLALAAAAAALLAWAAARRWLDAVQSRAAAGPFRAGRLRRFARARTWTTAFLRRDAALLARDWTLAVDIATAGVLWALLPLVLSPVLELPAGALARSMLVLLATGLGYEVAARALPLERHLIAWAALSPVGVRGWVLRRAVGVAALSLPIMLLAGSAIAVSIAPAPEALAHAALLGVGAWALATGIGLATGAIAGDRDWIHPRAMLGLGGRLAASLAAVLQAGGWSAVGWALESPGLGPELAAALAGLAGGALGLALAIRSVQRHDLA